MFLELRKLKEYATGERQGPPPLSLLADAVNEIDHLRAALDQQEVSSMSSVEKIEKFDELQKWLWGAAVNGNALQSIAAASIIRQFAIPGPEGEDPDSA